MENQMTQEKVNAVWGGEWEKGGYTAKALFGQRIFIEGYPVVRKHISGAPKMILDVGAATGRYAVKFAQDFPNAKVYATDILESSLGVVRNLVEEVGISNVVVQKEDALNLSFPDNSFDVVYSGMVLQIIPDAEKMMSEMKRVLKPGGSLIVTTVNFWNFHTLFKWYLRVFNRPPEYYGHEEARSFGELSELFQSKGLEVVALDGFSPAYGIYRLKKYWKPAKLIGSALNRFNKIIDPWTGRFLSRQFGFEIFVVGRKK